MTGFRIICCSKLEPQTPSKFSLLVVKTEASLFTAKQAGGETVQLASPLTRKTELRGVEEGCWGPRGERWILTAEYTSLLSVIVSIGTQHQANLTSPRPHS